MIWLTAPCQVPARACKTSRLATVADRASQPLPQGLVELFCETAVLWCLSDEPIRLFVTGGAVAMLRASEGINGSSSALDGLPRKSSCSGAAPGGPADGSAGTVAHGAAAQQRSQPQHETAAATGIAQPAPAREAGPQYSPASFEVLIDNVLLTRRPT